MQLKSFTRNPPARLAALAACTVAFACALALVATAGSRNAARAATGTGPPVPYVSDVSSRDWVCDDTNAETWDDCPPGGEDPPPTDPTGEPEPPPPEPTEPTGPTGPPEPPYVQWPAPPHGAYAKLRANGRTAVAPKSAPPPVKQMVKAANRLTRKPYKWGGGHMRWQDRGYDCSGSVSYVLHAAGLLQWPLVSGSLANWGFKNRGRWVQIYANKSHVFMVIAGLRYDTSGYGESGPRWRVEPRGTRGFHLRHPPGL